MATMQTATLAACLKLNSDLAEYLAADLGQIHDPNNA